MVKQNKTNFVMDNYVSVNNPFEAREIIKHLIEDGVTFTVEPWPEETWRIYVKKDAKGVLDIAKGSV